MTWGKRTVPPDDNGGVPQLMYVCENCATLAAPYEPFGGGETVAVGNDKACEGCGKEVRYELYELPQSFWLQLEVGLALKDTKEENGTR